MCGGTDNIEHCYMLPSRWKDLLEYDKIGDKICANFQNACCTPIEFFVEENVRVFQEVPKPWWVLATHYNPPSLWLPRLCGSIQYEKKLKSTIIQCLDINA